MLIAARAANGTNGALLTKRIFDIPSIFTNGKRTNGMIAQESKNIRLRSGFFRMSKRAGMEQRMGKPKDKNKLKSNVGSF